MSPQHTRQARSFWGWLRDTQSNAAALAALGALLLTIVLAARGYVGLPERIGAVEVRTTAGETHDREQDAALALIARDRARMICLLEVIAANDSPLRCER